MNNVLWEEEARAWRLEMRVCGVTAPTRVLFLKHRVRHSVWWDVRAYGQIDGSAQMFALVKNWGSGGMFCSKIKKKRHQTKPHTFLSHARSEPVWSRNIKEEAFGGIERGRHVWRFGVCLLCLIDEELELHVMVQDVGEKCAGNPP